MTFIPPVKAYFPQEDRDWVATQISAMLESGQLTLGKLGKEFETEFAKFSGVKFAIAVNSGTSSIEIPLRILDVAGKDVLVPTNTFFATAAAVVHAGGNPVLVDIHPETMALDPKDLEKRLTPKTVGVILVHIAGNISPHTPAIADWCKQKGLWLFEDAAHAHGSTFNGKHAGTFGIAGSLSFYPTKVMTSGEGGMILTDDPKIDEEARLYRDQGKTSFLTNTHSKMGYNWRLSEPHAAIGLAQLRRLPEILEKRQAIAAIYNDLFKNFPFGRPLALANDSTTNYYKYVYLPHEKLDRPALKKLLKEKYQVCLSGEVYELPLHQQPVFQQYAKGSYPVAEDICGRHLCLPLFPAMTRAEAQQVFDSFQACLPAGREATGG
ncbi:MAG: DegT/DnrJ/EryC1/StrS family aminotransferase [Deltaproteobacteria bacterium]|nr:DegT/DnrJ/EryC1/StrS family aminotransferase [Deltaproteobacteria bacterium]